MSIRKDALREARVTLASIPIFAQALCGEKNVSVIFSKFAQTAMTDGKVITLPALPMPTSEQHLEACEVLADLVTLYIPHEVGHIRYSTFKPFQDMTSDLGRSLLNAIEDPRMELELIQDLPGTRGQLDRGCERVAELGYFPVLGASEPRASLMSLYVLYQLRGTLREQEPFLERAEATRPAVVEVFGERFADRLDILLATDGMSMHSTKDAAKLTNAILAVVKDEEQKAEEEKQQQEQGQSGNEQSDQDAGGSQDSSASSGSDGGQDSGDSQEPGKDSGQGSGGDGQGQDSGQDQGNQDGSGGNQGNTPGDASPEAGGQSGGNGAGSGNPFTDAIQNGDQGCKDLGDLVQDALGKAAAEADAQGVPRGVESRVQSAGAEQGSMQSETAWALNPEDAQMASRAMKARLRSMLQSRTLQRSHESVRGHRISNRRVHRTGQYDRRLFVHQDDQKGVETVVYLLGDTSSSMDGQRIRVMSDALYATADAMHALSGVKVGIGLFPGNRVVLPIGANPRSAVTRLGLTAAGGTPMGEAMYWAARQLVGRPEPRKILMVLTDGDPGDRFSVLAANEALEGHGVEVFGVGIELPSVRNHFAKACVVNDVDELPAQMLGMLHDALLKPQKNAA